MPYASSLSNNNLCGLDPVLFNIFLNDIFHFTTSSTLYNYADDNTLAHADDNIDKVVEHLEKDSCFLLVR
jgi:hypothetical protein